MNKECLCHRKLNQEIEDVNGINIDVAQINRKWKMPKKSSLEDSNG